MFTQRVKAAWLCLGLMFSQSQVCSFVDYSTVKHNVLIPPFDQVGGILVQEG